MENKTSQKLNLAGRLAKLFLEHTQLTVLSILIILVWGVASFILMPKQYNPEIVAPAFIVSVDYPGATSQEVYELVTKPLENKIREIKEVDEMAASSYDGGKSVVMVRFLVGSDMEKAKITLNQKLNDGASEKPMGAGEAQVVNLDPDDVPIMAIGLTSEELSESSLRKMALDLAADLKHADGVSKIDVLGGRTNNIQVDLDMAKLAAHKLTAMDVMNAIGATNNAYSIDKLEGMSGKNTIRISGAVANAEEAKQIVLFSADENSFLTLGDVADVTYGPGEITDYVRLQEKDQEAKPLVYLAVSKLKESNITDVSKTVKKKLEEAERSKEADGAQVSILRDEGAIAGKEIGTLTKHLIISILIVTSVLVPFLGLRNSLIVAVAIPLTLLASFGVGFLFHQTINRITLFALILALGLLVDDAIVIIENVHRFSLNDPEKSRLKLAIAAVNEVGAGVFMSTITVILAFVPMAFVTGMMGPYMGPIPFFVSVTMLISLFIAFTINPALTVFLGSKEKKHHENIFIRAVERLKDSYGRVIGRLIRNNKTRRKVLYASLVLFLVSLSLPIFRIVRFRMLPKADKEQFYVYLDLPNDYPAEKTSIISETLEKKALENPNVESIESTVGASPVTDFNGMFKGGFTRVGENQSTIKINLSPPENRKETSENIASDMRSTLLGAVKDEPDAKIKIVEDPPGPPVRSTIFLKVQGNDPERLNETAQDVKNMLKEIPGVTDIDTSFSARPLEYSYKIDLEKARRLNVYPTDIAQTLHIALSGLDVSRYKETNQNEKTGSSEQEFIILRAGKNDRDNVANLDTISVRNSQNEMIPVNELVIPVASDTLPVIESDQQRETVYVSAEMDHRSVMYAMLDLFPRLLHYRSRETNSAVSSWSPLNIQYGAGQDAVNIALDGEWKLTLEIFRDLGIAMGLALFLIYFVLVVQLHSLRVPILIMMTIPLALIGVLWGFAVLNYAKGTFFNATSMIGVIALAGIVVKNAIIYLAYLDELKAAGQPLQTSLIEAGRTRLLPIMLTSLTAVLGSLAIISDPVWEGLAWSIIFGLSVSTVLTLVIFPLLYLEFEGKDWKK